MLSLTTSTAHKTHLEPIKTQAIPFQEFHSADEYIEGLFGLYVTGWN